MNIIKTIKHSMPLKILIPILIISLASVVSFAASVAVNPATSQTVQGVMYTVTGGFTAANNGFVLTQTHVSATKTPAAWVNGGTVSTATVTGNWQYSLTLTMNKAATANTTYTVSVQWDSGNGYSQLGKTLTFTTPATISNNQKMTFVFDTGVTSFNVPVGIMITVA
jgi:uncharacterized GH25 family protein